MCTRAWLQHKLLNIFLHALYMRQLMDSGTQSCVERSLFWLAEGREPAVGGASESVQWLVRAQTIESRRLLHWMAATLGGVWVTMLEEKTFLSPTILGVLFLIVAVFAVVGALKGVWVCVCVFWETENKTGLFTSYMWSFTDWLF